MAEEFVRNEHFDEFVLRMDGRFLGIEKRIEQGFAHAEKSRKQNFVHVNQRPDSIERSLPDIRADPRQMRNGLIGLRVFIALGFWACWRGSFCSRGRIDCLGGSGSPGHLTFFTMMKYLTSSAPWQYASLPSWLQGW